MSRMRGARDLVFDGIEAVTQLVQETHVEVSERWTKRVSLVAPAAPIAETVNAIQLAAATTNYAAVRLVSRGVGSVVKTMSDPLLSDDEDGSATPMCEDARGSLPWWLDQAETTLNSFLGDHLADSDNGLALGMTLRDQGRVVPLESAALSEVFPDASSKICVFVHGLCATEWSWVMYADRVWGDARTCYGTKLKEDLGVTPLFVRYNSGRSVHENGEALSQLLEQLAKVYPVPIEEIVLIGHSMGGLVVRSAAHAGASSKAAWTDTLRRVFCLGSPNQGAPLAKGAQQLVAALRSIPAAGASVTAAVSDARSVGIKDLSDGCAAPRVDGVAYHAVAATVTEDPNHPVGKFFGDMMVRRSSATAEEGEGTSFDSNEVFSGMNHLQVANHPAVYEMLRANMTD